MSRGPEEYPAPVDLPEGVWHCTPNAYNHYKCRCFYCSTWSKLYQQARQQRRQQLIIERRQFARDYLARRGIQVYGSGPFRRNPTPLARIVAKYLGDDFDAWADNRAEFLSAQNGYAK